MAFFKRVSNRSFSKTPLTLEQTGQLLWASQGTGIDGVTGATRTAPSAGAAHPVQVYLVAGLVDRFEPGVYRYEHEEHKLIKTISAELREKLAESALNQQFIADAPASIILAADYEKTTFRYGNRGIRYVHMEIGHLTQNISLQCVSLDLGGVAVGAFDDKNVKELLQLEDEPLLIFPFGNITDR